MRIHLHPSFHFQVTIFSEKKSSPHHHQSPPPDSWVDFRGRPVPGPGDTHSFHWSIDSGRARVSIEVASWRKLPFFLMKLWKMKEYEVEKLKIWTLKCWKSHRVWRRLNIESIWAARFLDGILLCRLCHLHLHIYLLGKLLQFTSLTSRGFHLNTNLLYLLGRVISCAIS